MHSSASSAPQPLVCEIVAPAASSAAALAEVAVACAQELGQPLAVRSLHIGDTAFRQPLLTLHLPAALAASQHRIWCLACRLACFCPEARVSILVLGRNAFVSASKPADRPRRKSA